MSTIITLLFFKLMLKADTLSNHDILMAQTSKYYLTSRERIMISASFKLRSHYI